MRLREGNIEEFWTTKGVRQGCVLSPLLFNIYIVDIGNVLKKRGIGEITVGNDRVWSIAYADDIVVIAKNRVAILDMINTRKIHKRKRIGNEYRKVEDFSF